MRDLCIIIDEVLLYIPEQYTELRDELGSIQQSALFASPEMMGFWWKEFAVLLTEQLSDVRETWVETIAQIFSGKEKE